MKVGPEYIILLLLLLWPQYFYILTVLYIFFKIFFFCFFFWRFNQSQRIPKSSISRQNGCAHRLMLKPFKWNVFWVQMIEQFVRGGDAASRQITLTTSYHYYRLYFILTFHGIVCTVSFYRYKCAWNKYRNELTTVALFCFQQYCVSPSLNEHRRAFMSAFSPFYDGRSQ